MKHIKEFDEYIKELDFSDEEDLVDYTDDHEIRKGTKVTIGGKIKKFWKDLTTSDEDKAKERIEGRKTEYKGKELSTEEKKAYDEFSTKRDKILDKEFEKMKEDYEEWDQDPPTEDDYRDMKTRKDASALADPDTPPAAKEAIFKSYLRKDLNDDEMVRISAQATKRDDASKYMDEMYDLNKEKLDKMHDLNQEYNAASFEKRQDPKFKDMGKPPQYLTLYSSKTSSEQKKAAIMTAWTDGSDSDISNHVQQHLLDTHGMGEGDQKGLDRRVESGGKLEFKEKEAQERVNKVIDDIYKETQDKFKEQGKDEITLYRGTADDTDFDNPLESWTSDKSVAKSYDSNIHKIKVPTSRIFMSAETQKHFPDPITMDGDKKSNEFVLMGGTKKK